MKKERVEITKSNNYIHFYLSFGEDRIWLFSQPYSMSVENYFRTGRSVSEIRRNNSWRENPRLEKTIERVYLAITFTMKEYKLPYKDGKRRYYRTTYRDLYSA